jgi:uncharacterized protein YndB with AHSA1/START domain
MNNNSALTIAPSGEREIIITRAFEATRDLVFDALTKPELVKRWLLGPPGWSMPVCEIDLKVGGAYRYVWHHDEDGCDMGMGGTYREIVRPERIVNTELFDKAWYSGDCLVTTRLVEQGAGTTMTVTLRYDSRAIRDGVLKSDMEDGVAPSYDRLEEIVTSKTAGK